MTYRMTTEMMDAANDYAFLTGCKEYHKELPESVKLSMAIRYVYGKLSVEVTKAIADATLATVARLI